jgi:hypothetical protein
MPKVADKPAFRPFPMSDAAAARAFAQVPELVALAEPRLFDAGAVTSIADAATPRDVVITSQPILYSPEPGAEFVVLTGKAQDMVFVVALYPLRDDKYRLASSFLMPKETAATALAYRPGERRLSWTSCWGCPGREGLVTVLSDHRVRIVQR